MREPIVGEGSETKCGGFESDLPVAVAVDSLESVALLLTSLFREVALREDLCDLRLRDLGRREALRQINVALPTTALKRKPDTCNIN